MNARGKALGRTALAEGFRHFHGFLLAYAERRIERANAGETTIVVEASEVVERIYVSALEKSDQFAGKTQKDVKRMLKGYVRMELRRQGEEFGLKSVRARTLSDVGPEETLPPAQNPPPPLEVAITLENSRRVLDAFKRLSPIERALLILLFIKGMTLEQAARFLRLRRSTAQRYQRRGIEKLRCHLPDLDPARRESLRW